MPDCRCSPHVQQGPPLGLLAAARVRRASHGPSGRTVTVPDFVPRYAIARFCV
jgi:hypothetical protein